MVNINALKDAKRLKKIASWPQQFLVTWADGWFSIEVNGHRKKIFRAPKDHKMTMQDVELFAAENEDGIFVEIEAQVTVVRRFRFDQLKGIVEWV